MNGLPLALGRGPRARQEDTALSLRPIYGLYLDPTRQQPLKLSRRIKPISYLKAHTAEVVRELADRQEPLIITQNGEAKVVIQDIDSYEQTQEAFALLKILALGDRQVAASRLRPATDVIAEIRERNHSR